MNTKAMIEFVRCLRQEHVVNLAIRSNKMGGESGFGRAHGPNVQVMHGRRPNRWVETSRGRTGNEVASRVDRKCRLQIPSEAAKVMPETEPLDQPRPTTG